MKLRKYQIELSQQAAELLRTKKIAYLAIEVRVGKTLISLNAANLYGAKKVLFLTKKEGIKSIQEDYDKLNPDFEIVIINNESIHKIIENDFDLIISDEHHRCSAFPKPNKVTKTIKQRFGNLPMIFLSGTPAIESVSQWYHSFYVSSYSPFSNPKNFYEWFKLMGCVHTEFQTGGAWKTPNYSNSIDIVRKYFSIEYREISKNDPDYEAKKKQIDDRLVNALSRQKDAEKKILSFIEPYLIKYTQVDAGFTSTVNQKVLFCEMQHRTSEMVKHLLRDRILEGKTETVLGDAASKLMSKVHQISNGTVIFESGNSTILDKSKAEFIRDYFSNQKIAIFYFFQKELELLKDVFGDSLTTDLETFNTSDKNIALQQVAGSESISLKAADSLVYYSFGYSGKNFVQGIARMATIDRKEQNVYFVMQKDDINSRIYQTVKTKKRYSEKLFLKEYKL